MRSPAPYSLLASILALLAACSDDKTDSGGASPPCADGAWGLIADPDAALHVSQQQGSASGDGSLSDPLNDLNDALDLLADAGLSAIAIWPGSYSTETLNILGDAGQGDTQLQGCSCDEVTVSAQSDDESVILVRDATDFQLAGITLQGGTRALDISGAVGSDIRIEDVAVLQSQLAGVVIDGPETIASVQQLQVAQTVASNETSVELGIGLVIDGASVELYDSSFADSTLVGVLADNAASISFDEVTVSDTQQASGQLGRGIQLQGRTSGTISNCHLLDNHDAGLFALLAPDLVLTDNEVDGVGASDLADHKGVTSGDGIVISAADGTKANYDASDYLVSLSGNTVSGWAVGRAGVYLENVHAQLEGNDLQDEQLVYSDKNAQVTGSDVEGKTAPIGIQVQELAITAALDVTEEISPSP